MRFCLLMLVFMAVGAFAHPQSLVSTRIAGVVFEDRNGDRRRDPGEPGLGGVVVCSRSDCASTGQDGSYEVAVESGYWTVFVRQPDGFRPVGTFWRRIPQDPDEWLINFPLERAESVTEFTFLHASDTHLDEESLPRLEQLRAIVEREEPAFVLVTGDLIRDALRVGEEVASERYRLYRDEMRSFPVPVWSVPGNHENFGIERHLSGVSEDHPLFGKAMFRRYLGPNYYSFDYGGMHFVALDTADVSDRWYYGHVDAIQLEWLEEDLSRISPTTPVVTFNHIPFVSALVTAWGYYPPGEAPGSIITIDGKEQYRHVVSNFDEVRQRLAGHPYPLALGGHVHAREEIVLGEREWTTRFHQTAAVVGDTGSDYGMDLVSGVTLYRVKDQRLVDWRFIPLDGTP